VRSATCRQTPSLATAARNCDQIATKRRVTARDGCPTRAAEMAVDQGQRGREGIRRTGGDGWWLTTDLAVGGSNPSRRATSTQVSGPVAGSPAALGPPDCDQTATTPAGTPNRAATTCDHLRPQSAVPASFLLISATEAAQPAPPAAAHPSTRRRSLVLSPPRLRPSA